MDYEKELSVAMELARKAGKLIMESKKNEASINEKDDGTKVTSIDIKSEELIIEGIKKNFPNDGIVSEESAKIRSLREWHIDPLDGTGSFLFGSDEFTVNIGLCENGVPVLGIVIRPATGELYLGVKDKGAYKINSSGQKHSLSVQDNGGSDMCAVIAYNEKASSKNEIILKAAGIKKSIKIAGAGLRIISIADNKADIFVTPLLDSKTWDLCGPQIILEEAGGCMQYINGKKIDYDDIINFPNYIIAAKSIAQMKLMQKKLSGSL